MIDAHFKQLAVVGMPSGILEQLLEHAKFAFGAATCVFGAGTGFSSNTQRKDIDFNVQFS